MSQMSKARLSDPVLATIAAGVGAGLAVIVSILLYFAWRVTP